MMLGHTAPLYIGPAGWHRREWLNLLGCQQGHRPIHPLARLAELTNLAEISQTSSGPLKPEISTLYAGKVAHRPDFLFTAPLWRRFTFDRDLDPAAVAAFKEGLRPLLSARRLGALILEFPWAFRFNASNREFLIELRRTFHEFPLAAEFRHESWLQDEAVTTLIHYRVAFVNIDQPAYFRALPPSALITSGVALVRLHGRSGPEAHQEFNAPIPPYLYSTDELEDWVARIRRLTSVASRVLVVAGSGRGARSLVTSLQLHEMLGARRRVAPAPLIARYPAELAGYRTEMPVQTSLPLAPARWVA
jgi:uncharacterized protein YecE (DUF72 family)